MSRALLERQVHDDAPRPLFTRSGTARALVVVPPEPSVPTVEPPDLDARIAAARTAAERDARAAMRDELDAHQVRLAAGLERLERAVRSAARPEAGEVVELALIAAREILGRAASIDHALLLGAVDAALDAAGDDAAAATVRLAPADLAWLRAHQPERLAGLRLIEDPRLEPGGCVVETARRVVDASIEARLDAVRRAIHDALADEAAP